MTTKIPEELGDLAAILAIGMSLYDSLTDEPDANVSEVFNGVDQFMRECMHAAVMFETWAMKYVDFDSLTDVWPYILENSFGPCFVRRFTATHLRMVLRDEIGDAQDEFCLAMARQLRLTVYADKVLLPVDIKVFNTHSTCRFDCFHIRTTAVNPDGSREQLITEEAVQEVLRCAQCDMGPLQYSLYGELASGVCIHVADRESYADARELVSNLCDFIDFPVHVLAPLKPTSTQS